MKLSNLFWIFHQQYIQLSGCHFVILPTSSFLIPLPHIPPCKRESKKETKRRGIFYLQTIVIFHLLFQPLICRSHQTLFIFLQTFIPIIRSWLSITPTFVLIMFSLSCSISSSFIFEAHYPDFYFTFTLWDSACILAVDFYCIDSWNIIVPHAVTVTSKWMLPASLSLSIRYTSLGIIW